MMESKIYYAIDTHDKIGYIGLQLIAKMSPPRLCGIALFRTSKEAGVLLRDVKKAYPNAKVVRVQSIVKSIY